MKELVELERLGDEIRCPPLDRIHRILHSAETCDHDGDDARVAVPGAFNDPSPIDAWQPKVRNHDVESELLEKLQGSLTAVGLHNLKATFRQPLRHQATEGGLVIDDKQVGGGPRRLQGANILTQAIPNERSAAADTAIEAVRRAKWLAVTN